MRNSILIIIMSLSIMHVPTLSAWSFKNVINWKHTETVRRTYDFKDNGTVTLNAIHGPITIKVHDKSTLQIIANKTGSEEDIAQVSVESKVDDTNATIKTIEPENGPSIDVEYIIKVPRKTAKVIVTNFNGPITVTGVPAFIDVTTGNGEISITGATKATRAKTRHGSINIEHTALPSNGLVFIETMKGHVNLTLPKNTHAQLNARTLKGKLTSSVPITLDQRTTTLDEDAWARYKREALGTIGSGEKTPAPINIDVSHGNINIEMEVPEA